MTAATPTNLGRAFDLYRRTAGERSAIALIVANAIPLIGVLFFGWSLITILVLFWIENGIVGFWNIPRIWLARGSILQSLPDMPADAALNATGNARAAADLQARWKAAQGLMAMQESGGARSLNPVGSFLLNAGGAGRVMMSVWFLFHYGIFWIGHGIFVFALPNFAFAGGGDCFGSGPGIPSLPTQPSFPELPLGLGACASPFGEVVWSNVWLGAAALFISHGASFFLNYIGKREYLTTSAMRQMFAPYSRVVMLHVTIIFGAFIVAILGAPIGALIVLVVLKTAFDLRQHLREHRAAVPVLAEAPNPA
jgi:hypothetical protein